MRNEEFFDKMVPFIIKKSMLKKLGLVTATVLTIIIDESKKQNSHVVAYANLEKAKDLCYLPSVEVFQRAAEKLKDLGYIDIIMPCQVRKKIQYILNDERIVKDFYYDGQPLAY